MCIQMDSACLYVHVYNRMNFNRYFAMCGLPGLVKVDNWAHVRHFHKFDALNAAMED